MRRATCCAAAACCGGHSFPWLPNAVVFGAALSSTGRRHEGVSVRYVCVVGGFFAGTCIPETPADGASIRRRVTRNRQREEDLICVSAEERLTARGSSPRGFSGRPQGASHLEKTRRCQASRHSGRIGATGWNAARNREAELARLIPGPHQEKVRPGLRQRRCRSRAGLTELSRIAERRRTPRARRRPDPALSPPALGSPWPGERGSPLACCVVATLAGIHGSCAPHFFMPSYCKR